MSNLDAGGPATGCRLEVDEEPPGSPLNLFACPSTSQALRPHWPHVFAGREYLVHSARIPRPPRSTPQTRSISPGVLPRHRRQGVERLALAGPQSHPRPRPTGANAQPLRRGAGGPALLRGDAALRDHPLLHEPPGAGQPPSAAPPHRRPHGKRANPLPRRGRRPARRRARQPGAGPGPSLSGPRAAAADRFLLELLPLLHPLANGRTRRNQPQPRTAGKGPRLHPPHARNPRRPPLRRRSADAQRP